MTSIWQENAIAIGCGKQISPHSVPSCNCARGVVYKFFPLFLSWHTPSIPPVDGGSIVIRLKHGQCVGEAIITLCGIVTILGQVTFITIVIFVISQL